jgi:hypothetical protein
MYKNYIQKLSLEELYQTVLIRTGQYLVQDALLSQEFPLDKFELLLKNQIYPLYQKYVYKGDKIVTYVTYATPYVFPEPAPDTVNAVIPVSVYGLYIGEFLNFRFLTHTSYLSTKPLTRFSIAWDYRKPALFVGYQGEVEVRASWKLQYDESNKEMEIDPETRDILVDLAAGYLLSALGRSRRMVKIGDTNLEMDSDALVEEGEGLIKEARDRLVQFLDLTALNF